MKAYLFDIDGTLIHSSGLGRLPYQQVFRELFAVEVDLDRVEWAGRPDLDTLSELAELHGIEKTLFLQHWNELKKSYLFYLEKSLRENSHALRVLPGVSDWIDSLSNEALGIVTGNISEAAFLKLSLTHLDSYFPYRIGGFGEDHADRGQLVQIALKRMLFYYQQDTFESVWVIGDSHRDIECARQNHLNSLSVATGMQNAEELEKHAPTLLIEDFTQIQPSFLDQFAPTPWTNPKEKM